jgi:hypothetical protein
VLGFAGSEAGEVNVKCALRPLLRNPARDKKFLSQTAEQASRFKQHGSDVGHAALVRELHRDPSGGTLPLDIFDSAWWLHAARTGYETGQAVKHSPELRAALEAPTAEGGLGGPGTVRSPTAPAPTSFPPAAAEGGEGKKGLVKERRSPLAHLWPSHMSNTMTFHMNAHATNFEVGQRENCAF